MAEEKQNVGELVKRMQEIFMGVRRARAQADQSMRRAILLNSRLDQPINSPEYLAAHEDALTMYSKAIVRLYVLEQMAETLPEDQRPITPQVLYNKRIRLLMDHFSDENEHQRFFPDKGGNATLEERTLYLSGLDQQQAQALGVVPVPMEIDSDPPAAAVQLH